MTSQEHDIRREFAFEQCYFTLTDKTKTYSVVIELQKVECGVHGRAIDRVRGWMAKLVWAGCELGVLVVWSTADVQSLLRTLFSVSTL